MTVQCWRLLLAGVLTALCTAAQADGLRGTIVDDANRAVAGVTVTPSGGLPATVTDASGAWHIDLPTGSDGRTYTVTPSKAGWAFTPAQRQVTVSGGEAVADFAGARTVALAVSASNLAPLTVKPGVFTPLLKVRLLALNGPITVHALFVREIGTVAAADLRSQLFRGGVAASAIGVPADPTSKITALSLTTPIALAAGAYVDLELRTAVAAGAVGKSLQASIVYAGAVKATAPAAGAFPLKSSAALVVAGPWLGVSGQSVAPATVRAGQFEPLLKLRLAANDGPASVTSLTLRESGSAPATALSLQLAIGTALVPARAVLEPLTRTWTVVLGRPLAIAAGAYTWVTVQERAAPSAGGLTLRVEALDAAAVGANVPVAGTFPIVSGEATVDPSPLIQVTGYSVAANTVPLGVGAPLLKVRLEAFNGPGVVSALQVRQIGSAPAGSVTLKVLRAGLALPATIVFDPLTQSWTVTPTTPISLAAGAILYLELQVTCAPEATGRTVCVSLENAAAVTASVAVIGTFPLAAKAATVAPTPPMVMPEVSSTSPAAGVAVRFGGKALPDPGATITLYEWDFDGNGVIDHTSPTPPSVDHRFPTVGTYRAVLRATDSRGLQGSAVVTIYVAQPHPPTVTALASPTAAVLGMDVRFDGRVTPGDATITITTYEWDFDADGTVDYTSAQSPATSYLYLASGLYNASLRATDERGLSAVGRVQVSVGPVPALNTTGANVAPTTTQVATPTRLLDLTFTATGAAARVTGLQLRALGTAPGDSVSFQVRQGTALLPSATVWDAATRTWGVVLRSPLGVTAGGTAAALLEALCGKDAGGLTVGVSLVDRTAVQSNAVNTGNFPISSSLVTVAVPQAPAVTATATPAAAGARQPIQFGGSATPVDGGTTIVSYDWDFDNDGVYDRTGLTAAATSSSYALAGTYTAVLRATDNRGVSGVGRVTVTVAPPQRPRVTASATPTRVATGFPVRFAGTAQAGDAWATITRYDWDFDNDGTVDATSATTADATWRYSAPGNFNATLTVTNDSGLTSAATVALVVFRGGLLASPWPKHRADLTNTGVGQGSGSTGVRLWTYAVGANVLGSPVIADNGMVIIGANGAQLLALDGATGTRVWRATTTADVSSTAALGADGNAYFGCSDRRLYAVSTATGAARWSFLAGGPISGGATVAANGMVLFGVIDGRVHALDASTGTQVWAFTTGGPVYATPAVGSDGVVYIASADSKVYALDGLTGAQKWVFTTGGPVYSSPALSPNRTLYVGSDDGKVYALDASTGSLKWAFTTAGAVRASAALGADGTVYIGSADQRLYALSGSNGAQKWALATGGAINSSAALASDGTLYVGSGDQRLYAVNSATGARQWSYAAGGAVTVSPAVGADGTVYCAANNTVFALGSAAPTAPTVTATANPTRAMVGRAIAFSGTATAASPGATIDLYEWDFESDGTYDATSTTTANAARGYTTPGAVTATLRVTDSTGASATATVDLDITPGGPSSAPWPKWRANVRNTGVGVGQGATGTRRWVFATGGPITGSVSIGPSQTLYVGSRDLRLHALDTGSGLARWAANLGADVASTPAVAVDGTVYVGAGVNVYALDGTTGARRWQYAAGGQVLSSPTIGADGTVYVGTMQQRVLALDGATGAAKWTFTAGTSVSSSPALGADGTVYIGSTDGKVYALSPADGTQKWAFTTGGAVHSSPAIGVDGTVYVGSSDRKLYALDGATGAPKWSYTTGGEVQSSPAVAGTLVYVGSFDAKVYALDATTGALRWSFTTGRTISSSPSVAADGTVYIGSQDQRLYALNGATGTLKWSVITQAPITAVPAIDADGSVYIGSNDGRVYALGTAAGQPPTVTALANPANAPVGRNIAFGGNATPAEAGATIVSYRWDFDGDGTFDTVGSPLPTATRPMAAEGTYNAVLEATDSLGSVGTGTVQVVITALLRPNVTATAVPATAPRNVPVQFGGSATPGDPGTTIIGYRWDFDGDGTFDTPRAPTAAVARAFRTAGTYTAVLEALDSAGTTGTASVQVVVQDVPGGPLAGLVQNAATRAPLAAVNATLSASLGQATTDAGGSYTINNVPAGFPADLAFAAAGFLPTTMYGVTAVAGQTVNLETVQLVPDNLAGPGNIGGTISDATTANGVPDAAVRLRPGINQRAGNPLVEVQTTATGAYTFAALSGGNYTAEVVKSGYITGYFTVVCLGGQTRNNQDGVISPTLTAGQTRVVLTWGATPSDLDSHMTVPDSQGGRLHLYYVTRQSTDLSVELDVDQLDGYGPETFTLHRMDAGQVYRYAINDFTNKWSNSSRAMSQSGATVRIYQSQGLIQTFNIPTNQVGVWWTVFEIRDGTITPINTITNTPSDPDMDTGIVTPLPLGAPAAVGKR
jgi:outer membrane protein assembly factor BamB